MSVTPYTVNMAMLVSKPIARQVAKVIEDKKLTISEALGNALGNWLEEIGEPELGAMVRDGRGIIPRRPLRH